MVRLAFILWISASIVGSAQWIAVGPTGGNPRAMVERGSVFYVALDPGGVYASTDGMNSWNELNNGLPTPFAYALEVNAHGEILVGTSDGMFIKKESDSWSPVDATLFGTTSITTIDAMSDGVYMAGGMNGESFRSSDGGRTWTRIANIPNTNFLVNDFHAVQSNLWFCAAGGLYASNDKGLTWNRHVQYDNVSREAKRISSCGGAIYVAGSSVCRSTSNGAAFTQYGPNGNFSDALCDGGTLYYASGTSISVTHYEYYRSWGALDGMEMGFGTRFYKTSEDSVVLLAMHHGLLTYYIKPNGSRFEDTTWILRNNGLNFSRITSLWPLNNGKWIQTAFQKLLTVASYDGKLDTISLKNSRLTGISSLSRSASGRIAFLRRNSGDPEVYYSDDNGMSTKHVSFAYYDDPMDRGSVAKYAACIHPTRDSILSVAVDSRIVDVTLSSPQVRHEAGILRDVRSMTHTGDAVLIETPLRIIRHIVGSDSFDTVLTRKKAFRSRLTSPNPHTHFIIGDSALFRTTDAGITWQTIKQPSTTNPPTLIAACSADTFAIATDREVHISFDGGLSWQPWHGGLKGAKITTLAATTTRQLLAGTESFGLFLRYINKPTDVEQDSHHPSSFSILNVYPTPSHSDVNVSVSISSELPVTWQLISATGAVVKEWQDVAASTNVTTSLSLDGVTSGSYQLVGTAGNEHVIARVVILK